MKIIRWLFLLLFTGAAAQQGPELTLEQARQQARQHYPAIREKDLVKKTADISIENLQKGFLPQVALSGQATYQSEVTRVSIPVPGFSIEPPGKDQYRLVAEASQLLFDGGMTREQKTVQLLNARVEDQKLEVELYRIQDRVNQLFLGILFLEEQLRQTELVKNDIGIGLKKMEAQLQNGVVFRSSVQMLKAEWLKAEQRQTEIAASRKGMLQALGLFINQELNENTRLEQPVVHYSPADTLIQRPEIQLYNYQEKLTARQEKLIDAKNKPRATLFVQGGYGRPGLNMLKNEFVFYGIGGLRFNWALGGLYTRRKEREQVQINRQRISLQQESFLLGTRTQVKQQQTEIDKLEILLKSDEEIISLRHAVTEAAKVQLDNGVITPNDFLKEINAEDQARQLQLIHRIQLLQAKINYATLTGK